MKKEDYTVAHILREWLEQNGFNGLYCEDTGCGCAFDDFIPCGAPHTICQPGYLHLDYGDGIITDIIKPGKPGAR